MALTESTSVSVGGVAANGVVFVQKETTVFRDGVPIGPPEIWRGPLAPGSDLTGQDPLIVSVCNAVWTPDVVSAFQAEMARLAA